MQAVVPRRGVAAEDAGGAGAGGGRAGPVGMQSLKGGGPLSAPPGRSELLLPVRMRRVSRRAGRPGTAPEDWVMV